ncbi:glycoside hydrolase family 9 protein, partial [Nocardioides stalactiti]|uniref:glycoside hydrolase family 9 protein n=1 Tax=Nocardioides stalactiti TaxID=2755356 RepID=UPI0015FF27D6
HLQAATADGANNWLVRADGYEVGLLPAAELCGVLGAAAAPATYSDPACEILVSGGYNARFEVASRTAFGRAGEPQWASARANESAALTLLLADREGTQDFTPAMRRATGWFLGVNPWGVRMQVNGTTAGATVSGGITGPYHWTKAIGRPLPVGAVPGGPASQVTIDEQRVYCCDPVVLTAFDTPQQVYHQADAEDYVMNEVGLGYNAPAVLHFALLSPG